MAKVSQVLEKNLVDVADVARVLGTTPRSVQRWNSDSAAPRRHTEDRLVELDVVLELALEVMREEVAKRWIRRPNPSMSWDTPLAVVARGDFKQVLDVLDALAEGDTA